MNVAAAARPPGMRPPQNRPRAMGDDPLLSGVVGEIAVYLGALAVCAVLYVTGGAAAIINLLAPLVITLATGIGNFRMVRADRNALLTPLFAVRLIAMTMLGLGGLFHVVAPGAIRDQMDYLYMTGPDEAAKVYLVWLSGMALTMMGMATAIRMFGKPRAGTEQASPMERWNWRPAALAFLIGFTFEAALSLTESFGRPLPIPSSASLIFTAISMTGLFFLAEQFTRSTGAKLVCGAALLSSILLGLILMNKSAVLLPALMLVLGYLRARFSWLRLLASAALVMTLYLTISPVVFYSRIRDFRAHSTLASGSIEERLAYLADYANGDRIAGTQNDSTFSSFSRLDYVMPASFVIGQYDRGVPATEIATSGYMLIPRLLWPQKPRTTNAGLAVNHLLGVQSTNQIAVTMFADIYWNLGWAGLVLMAIAGLFMGIGTLVSRHILQTGDWLMMPFVFAAFRFSLSLDGNFASGMMIPIIMAIGLYWALRMARVMLPARLGGAV